MEGRGGGGDSANLVRYEPVPVDICGISASLSDRARIIQQEGRYRGFCKRRLWTNEHGNESFPHINGNNLITNRNVAARSPYRRVIALVMACGSESKPPGNQRL